MQSILIIEDHTDARHAMIKIVTKAFGKPVIDEVPTLGLARKKLADKTFDLIVLDLGLPDGNGEDFIVEIKSSQPNAYVVVSTIHDESDRLLKALENGAKGYLLKELPKEILVEEFKGILNGKPPLAPAVTRRLLEHIRHRSGSQAQLGFEEPQENEPNSAGNENLTVDMNLVALLTDREKEILGLLGKGFNRPEIAGILGISKHTVATHVAKVYDKLHITNRSEATLLAQELGLV